ncbi:MAG: glycosyltransferase family 9 protein, partial [Candidatus Latescibacterota bacterium]|nr:glycosyltransferase family 9 protein [Candidatus Latescibacterota bacterium]
EKERGMKLPDDLLCFSPPDLRMLASTLAQAQLFVGNDSGPGHIAAAVGTATLSLFGPTDPTLWAPRRETSRVLVAPMRELNELSVERAVEETMQTLASTH